MLPRARDVRHVKEMTRVFPVTAILGARQCGKTTLAKELGANHYFDLENPRDEAKFQNPQLLLENLEGLVVIDEIQLRPDVFPLLRFLVDSKKKQKYLILGSASRNLVANGSESLAGRIGFFHLGGFSLEDVGAAKWRSLWIKGGFPRSFLSGTERESMLWRENYITTFLERDIPQLGIRIPSRTLRRFWMMLSHYHGQVINYSEIGRAFGISDMTVRRYIEILEGTFMVRVLQPFFNNTSKRLVKNPKIYIRDSGLFHTLISVENENQLISNPKLGASWEGFALEETVRLLRKRSEEIFFWSTHSGAEIDLFFQSGGKSYGIEFKYADAPVLTKSMKSAQTDLKLAQLYVIYPGRDTYPISEGIQALPLSRLGLEPFIS
ncbi:MAG: ATP-binding protein [Spirochaetales bacterium]|nr:MAG: ATP-binding protein [Spirochaetales bacterium]